MAIDEKLFDETHQILKVLSNLTRIKILYLLEDKPYNVSEICVELGLEQSVVSHQLKILRELQLVSATRVKKNNYYQLDDPHILQVINSAMGHAEHVIRGKKHGE